MLLGWYYVWFVSSVHLVAVLNAAFCVVEVC